jgi:hypothetical protein
MAQAGAPTEVHFEQTECCILSGAGWGKRGLVRDFQNQKLRVENREVRPLASIAMAMPVPLQPKRD